MINTTILIPTYMIDQWLYRRTIECVESVFENTDNFQIVVIANGGKPEYISRIEQYFKIHNLKNKNGFVIKSHKPLGFVKAINAGLKHLSERIQYVVFLNNDCIVTPEWLDNMIAFDCDITAPWPAPEVWRKKIEKRGQNIKNWRYNKDKEGLFSYARQTSAMKKLLPTEFVAFYCVVFKRKVVDTLGNLDEIFGKGLFDDDDYLWRAREKGFKIGIAANVYVHHFAKQTFLAEGEEKYRKLFIHNWEIFKNLHPDWKELSRYLNIEKMIQQWKEKH